MGETATNCRKAKACVLLPAGTAMQTVGLGLMVGGILALGAISAPVLFAKLPREEAGAVMAIIFRRFDGVILISLGLALIGEAMRFGSGRLRYRGALTVARLVLLVMLTAGVAFSTLKLNADIERMHRAGIPQAGFEQKVTFARTHKLSETVYRLNLLVAALLLALTPFTAPVRPMES